MIDGNYIKPSGKTIIIDGEPYALYQVGGNDSFEKVYFDGKNKLSIRDQHITHVFTLDDHDLLRLYGLIGEKFYRGCKNG